MITLRKIVDPRGNLTVAEQLKDIPFQVRTVYWTYDVPGGISRGGHAHKHCREFIVAVEIINNPFYSTTLIKDFSSKQTFGEP